jgi:HSP20 family protein
MALRSITPSGNGGSRTLALNPFGFLQREIDRLFEDFSRNGLELQGPAQANLVPRMDVSETDKEIVITAEMPGLERKDVDISLENDLLTIRGEKEVESEKEDKNKNYQMRERSYGMFYRAIQLPPGIDPSKVQATMANGVLNITIPKPAQSQPKKIEVKEAA